MPNMIAKFAKRVLTGSVLLGAVVLAPKDGCDRLGTYDGSRQLTGFESPEDLLGDGGPDAVFGYGGPDTNPLFITDEEH
jgi:hypothetical protein